MDKSKLYASNIADNWDELPQTLKLVQTTPKLSFTVSESDKKFIDLMKPFAGKDELRPSMMGIYFDDDCVVATDAHKLVTIPNTSKYRGYALVKTNDKYVNYSYVIPEVSQLTYIKKFNITKLRTYIKSIIAGKYTNPITFGAIFKIDDLNFGMNVKFLDTILSFFEKLGEESIYIGARTATAPFVFCANKSFDFKKHPLALCMPLLLESLGGRLGAMDLDLTKEANYYFDFTDSEIHNKGGAVAHFDSKLTKADKVPFNMDFAPVIQKLMGNKYIAILNYVCVENEAVRATNLKSSVYCKIYGDIPNGIYEFVSDTLIQNPSQELSDFPTDNFEKPENRMVVSNDFIQNFQYAGKIAGDDELRIATMGVNLVVSNNSVRLCGTDAHRLFFNTVKCTNSSDFNVTINPKDLNYYFEAVENQPAKMYFGNRFLVENSESKFIGEVIDSRYANYLEMISTNNERYKEEEKSVYFRKNEVLSLIASTKFNKDESIIFVVNPNKTDVLDVYAGLKEKRKIGNVFGGVSKANDVLMSLERGSLIMPKIHTEIESDFCFNPKFLKDFLSIVTINDVNLYTAKNYVAPYFIDFKDVVLNNPAIKSVKPKPKAVDVVEAVEVVEQKPEAPKKVRVPKPKAEKPKPVEVEKPKMDEKYRILLNSPLPEYMLKSINELGKKTNGFTKFDEKTQKGTDGLVELVKKYLAEKEEAKEQPKAPEPMPQSNKVKLQKSIESIKLSIKYLSGESKTKQQAILKRLNLALKYLK